LELLPFFHQFFFFLNFNTFRLIFQKLFRKGRKVLKFRKFDEKREITPQWVMASPDTILKLDTLVMIQTKFGFHWSSTFRGEDF
jgi:hypothetical protein